MHPRRPLGLAFALTSAATFGVSGILAASLLEAGWSSGAVTLVRIAGGALVLLAPTLWLLRGRWGAVLRSWREVLVLGLLALGAHAVLYGHGNRLLDALSAMTAHLVMLNGLLAVFNLLPIHPLDGSRVVDGFIPDSLSGPWVAFKGAGIIPLGVLLLATELTGYSMFRPVLEWIWMAISAVQG